MKICLDCGTEEAKKLYEDPRDPPIDEKPCLCADCYENALDACIEDLEGGVADYREKLAALQKERSDGQN